MKIVMMAIAGICLLAAGTAPAQVAEPGIDDEVTTIYKSTTVLDIDQPMQVPGELVRPSNSYVPVKKGAAFDLLVPVRDNFLPEMMKTAGIL